MIKNDMPQCLKATPAYRKLIWNKWKNYSSNCPMIKPLPGIYNQES